MSLFLLVFFLLYGALHAHAFLKARAAFDIGTRTSIILVLFFTLMVLAPIIVRQAENAGLEVFARITAYAGYFWMGIIFLFFSASVLTDLYRLFVYLSGSILHKDVALFILSAKAAFLIPLFISLCVSAYGYREALNIGTEHLTIRTEKLPQGVDRLRIVQISDVHLGLIVRRERLRLILEKVKESDPDILVSTGDLVDGQINHLEGLAEMLREIKPRYGKYAVLGNHEYYAGIKQALAFKSAAGFMLLRDEGVSIDNVITLAGVDDPAAKYSGVYNKVNERLCFLLSPVNGLLFSSNTGHSLLLSRGDSSIYSCQVTFTRADISLQPADKTLLSELCGITQS